MKELGEHLRSTREEKGLSLAQVEEATKIRRAFLQALEEGSHDLLPPPVYVKGFLKSYAQFLGLDPQQVLSLYQPPEATPQMTPAPVMVDEPLEPLLLRRRWPLLVVALVIALAAAAWWAYPRYADRLAFLRATATPTITSILPSSTTVSPSPTPEPPTDTPAPTHTATATVTPTPTLTPIGVELRLEIVGPATWVRVHADDKVAFTGTLETGVTRTWRANRRIVLRCGKAGAVHVTVDGQEVGPLGELDQVVDLEWTAPGVPTRTPNP